MVYFKSYFVEIADDYLLPKLWPDKNRQMSIKVAQIGFHEKNDRF